MIPFVEGCCSTVTSSVLLKVTRKGRWPWRGPWRWWWWTLKCVGWQLRLLKSSGCNVFFLGGEEEEERKSGFNGVQWFVCWVEICQTCHTSHVIIGMFYKDPPPPPRSISFYTCTRLPRLFFFLRRVSESFFSFLFLFSFLNGKFGTFDSVTLYKYLEEIKAVSLCVSTLSGKTATKQQKRDAVGLLKNPSFYSLYKMTSK